MDLKIQNINDYPEQLQEYFHRMTIGSDFNIIGSSHYKNFLYSNDFDLNENYACKDTPSILNNLYQVFLNKFLESKKDPNQFITDFKCGEINNEAIKWNINDMKKGYQIIHGHKITFQDCLLMKSTIKLDEVVCIGNLFYDITNSFFLKIGNHYTYDHKKDIYESLEKDYDELVEEGKFFKAIKRQCSIYLLNHKNKLSKKLLNLLNSDSGRLYKVINDLNLIILLLELKYKKPSIDMIINNLQQIKYFASKISNLNINFVTTDIDKICGMKSNKLIIKNINSLINKLNKILNNDVKKFL
jgi:hypothetical protein